MELSLRAIASEGHWILFLHSYCYLDPPFTHPSSYFFGRFVKTLSTTSDAICSPSTPLNGTCIWARSFCSMYFYPHQSSFPLCIPKQICGAAACALGMSKVKYEITYVLTPLQLNFLESSRVGGLWGSRPFDWMPPISEAHEPIDFYG